MYLWKNFSKMESVWGGSRGRFWLQTQRRFICIALQVYQHIPLVLFKANHLDKGEIFRLTQNTYFSKQLKRVCR